MRFPQWGTPSRSGFENAQTLKDLGLIDVPQMALHVDLPDLRALTKRINGPRRYIEWQINQAKKYGKVEPPMAMQDAAAGAKSVGEAYQEALASFVQPPRKNLEALRVLWRLFQKRGQQAQPASAPAAPPATIA